MFFTNSNHFFEKLFFLIFFVSSAQAKLWISAPNVLQVCSRSFVLFMCFKCTSRWDWSWSRLIFCLPKFPPGTLLALTALCHGSWSWSILESVGISAWQHGGTIKLCPWSSSVLLYGENTHRGCFLTQATPKLHQTGTSDTKLHHESGQFLE